MTDLSREARALLEAAAGADDPSLADKARVHDALMARIAAAPAAPAAAPAATATAGMSLALKLVIALAVVGGLSVGTYLVTRDTEPPAITKLETPAPEPVPAFEPEPAPAIEPAPEPPAAAAEPAPAIEPEPASKTAARRPVKPSAAPDLESLLAEKRLLSAARRALDESHAGAALELCEEHQRRFPRGQLAAEREGTRVLALCELDRRADAITHAGKFLRAYPKHPMAARVRGSCAFAD